MILLEGTFLEDFFIEGTLCVIVTVVLLCGMFIKHRNLYISPLKVVKCITACKECGTLVIMITYGGDVSLVMCYCSIEFDK